MANVIIIVEFLWDAIHLFGLNKKIPDYVHHKHRYVDRIFMLGS